MDYKQGSTSQAALDSAIKPLYVISKLFGLAPFSSRFVPSKMDVVYTLTLNTLVFYYLSKLTLHFITFFLEKNMQIFMIPRILTIAASQITAVVAVISAVLYGNTLHKKLCFELIAIDKKIYKRHPTYRDVFKVLIIQTTVFILSVIWNFSYEMYLIGEHDFVLQVFARNIIETIGVLIIMQFVNIVYVLKSRFNALNENLASCFSLKKRPSDGDGELRAIPYVVSVPSWSTNDLESMTSSSKKTLQNDIALVSRVRDVRKIHNQLKHIGRRVDSFYGYQLVFQITFLLISFTTHAHSIILAFGENGNHILEQHFKFLYYNVIISFGYFVQLFAIAYVCHVTTDEANRTSSLVQDYILLDHLDNDVVGELNSFAQQLGDNKLVFTAHGLFPLDMTLLLGVAGTAATYLVILLQ